MAPIIKSDSGSVDSSSIISALGFTPFNETGDTLTGTGGSGFYGAIPQSSAPSTPASGFRLYANASGLLEWKGTNGFTRTFDGAANTADRAYTLPNSSGTIALEGTLTSLANPTIQNGFYQFVQDTAPTQRAVGVPLVAGDRWYKTDDGTEWFWNGTYWLSQIISQPATGFDYDCTSSSILTIFPFSMPSSSAILISGLWLRLRIVSGLHDTTNNWTISFEVAGISGLLGAKNSFTDYSIPLNTLSHLRELPLTPPFFANSSMTRGVVWVTKNGSPGNINLSSLTLYYRRVFL